ncbi:hypothetical protein JIR23_17855 [Bradyrhizobium diazoefficiens]|nr:hypothetical protein [Bradyrhizobium diazoefficiens]QQN61515.1 hypothetical protein JIR23_17855 [Bradyrhizobium diazoefficiens]
MGDPEQSGIGAGACKSIVDFRSNEADRIAPGSGWVLLAPAIGSLAINVRSTRWRRPSRGKLELRYGLRETL